MPPPLVMASGPPAGAGDPNNEVANWSEHDTDDGRKYWYNKVNLVSTYDKPFCLKSPEERSIAPCKWKEYSADGKKYYSDGVESL
jgi:pre-mRNA-processing factor 40